MAHRCTCTYPLQHTPSNASTTPHPPHLPALQVARVHVIQYTNGMIQCLPLDTQREQGTKLVCSGQLPQCMVSGEGLAPLEELTCTVYIEGEGVWVGQHVGSG